MTSKTADTAPDNTHDDKPSRFWVFAGIGVFLLGILAFVGLQFLGNAIGQEPEQEDRPPLVQTVQVEAEGRSFPIIEEGFLRPAARIGVVPEVSGKVASVNPKLTLGGRFEQGEVLFTIDKRLFLAQRAQAEADLQSARAALARAEADYNRQRELADIGAVSQARLEQAQAEFAAARARVAQAAAALDIADKQLEDTELRAPFPARVESEDVSVGQYVAPGNAVAQLYDTSAAEISVGLAPGDAAAVRRARTASQEPLSVTISPVAGSATATPLTGRIVELASALDPQARTVSVLIEVPEAFTPANDGLVFADDFVAVELPGLAEEPLYTAQAGVVRKESFVWIVGDDDTLQRVEITPVRRFRDSVVFSAERELDGREVVLTALTEEAEGMEVRIQQDEPQEQTVADASP